MINFSNCTVNPLKMFGGKNGNKIGIIYNDKNYMIKFPPIASKNPDMSYSNSCISEYICCKIFNLLGIPAQETLLGTYNNKIVVACKDLEEDDYKLKEFAFLKNAIVDSSQNGYGTELKDILDTIYEQQIINPNILNNFFWDMFIVDVFLGNFDRHNGNWGFLINEKTKDVKISPVYDCGSCMYPQVTEEQMQGIIDDEKKINERLYVYPTSAIKIDGVKINYYNFLTTTTNVECIHSLKKIHSRIDMKKINELIDNTPYISSVHKNFLKIMISERKTKILDYALNMMLSKENA